MRRMAKIGLYICHCGINISSTLDIEELKEYGKGLLGVEVVRDYSYMCSEPGQALIKEDIEAGIQRVVVASCSPRMHEATFQQALRDAGLNPYLLEMANIREQCSWVHQDKVKGTEKAKRLIAAATSRAETLQALNEERIHVYPSTLVIGGGVAGLHVALCVAGAGFKVYLIEREERLGGLALDLYRTYPEHHPISCLIPPLIERVLEEERIEVMTETTLKGVEGHIGDFIIEAEMKKEIKEFKAGTIVVATGALPFDATKKKEYSYKESERIITSVELEKLLREDDLQIEGERPREIAFIQCVGSRDESLGHAYCSRICCMYTAKEAATIKEMYPETRIRVYYMDVRAFGKGCEEYYDKVRRLGVHYIRGNPSAIYIEDGRPVISVEDTLTSTPMEDRVDLVVLAVGLEQREETKRLAQFLSLSFSADGFFLEAHPKLRPVDTAVEGVYLAGTCQGPKDITDTINQAKGAAAAAMIPLAKGEVVAQPLIATVIEDLCRGCGLCVEICLYRARYLHPQRKVALVEDLLCQGCGGCVMACPNGATQQKNTTQNQLLAMVDAILD